MIWYKNNIVEEVGLNYRFIGFNMKAIKRVCDYSCQTCIHGTLGDPSVAPVNLMAGVAKVKSVAVKFVCNGNIRSGATK